MRRSTADRSANRNERSAKGRRLYVALAAASAWGLASSAAAAEQSASPRQETLVFVRHGEKPAQGYGQLDCQGLNRALALPAVIAAKFGKPDAIYAPNPSRKKKDDGVLYDYIRPLMTIEPTAVQFGMPVDTTYGYSQIDALEHALVRPENAGRLIVTAWEHHEIEQLVRQVVGRYGDATQTVPRWESDDFDSIYVVKIEWPSASASASAPDDTTPRATFTRDREGLNGRAKDCPCAALPDAPAAAAR